MNSRLDTADRPDTAVSLFRPGENCREVVTAERLGLIIDGEQYFRAFREAAETARESILILAWDFDSRAIVDYDAPGDPLSLGELLNRIVRRQPDLHVHVLIWDYPMIYAFDREFPPIYGLGWKPDRRVHLHYDSSIPVGACHHQKVAVIDDRIAFAGGLDLTSRRWDTCEHKPDEPRRTLDGKAYAPFHDTMMAVSGEAAQALGRLARERWSAATGETIPEPGTPRRRRFQWAVGRLPWRRRGDPARDPWPEAVEVALEQAEVAISLTRPAVGEQPAVREIELLYLDMIAAAREAIFIENQYFTAHRLGEAIEARLGEENGPDIVVVVRLLSHGWLEGVSMEALRTGLILRLRAADRHGRFKVYYPRIVGLPEDQCLDVHSKLMIVDDQILRIGSANFANRSMGFDTECDLTIEAAGNDGTAAVIDAFRTRLLAEHLEVDLEDVEAALRKEGRLIGAIESIARNARDDQRTLAELEVTEDESNTLGGIAKLADPEDVVPLDGLVDEFGPAAGATPGRIRTWLPLVGLVATVAGLVALWRFTPLAGVASPEGMMRMVDVWSTEWWIVPALLAGYVLSVFVLFPRSLLTLFAVLAFGAWAGFGIAMSGLILATIATWAIGRRLDRHRIRRLAGRNINRISLALRRRGVIAMTVLRILPLAPFAVVGLVAGAARVPFRDLVIGTVLGVLPGTVITTLLGGRVASLLRDPQPSDWWLLGGVLVAAVAIAMLIRRKLVRVQLPTTAP